MNLMPNEPTGTFAFLKKMAALSYVYRACIEYHNFYVTFTADK